MVSPIHLLLFGSRKVDYVDGMIRLDNWINLDMNPQHAAAIVALRPALESLVVRASKNPETILELSPTEEEVTSTRSRITMYIYLFLDTCMCIKFLLFFSLRC